MNKIIAVGNRFPLVVTVENTFPASSFFLKKRGTSEMSSMGHRTFFSIDECIPDMSFLPF